MSSENLTSHEQVSAPSTPPIGPSNSRFIGTGVQQHEYFSPPTEQNITFFPDRLSYVLSQIPKLADVETGRKQLLVSKITDKPYAMDLRDEVRHIQELLQAGVDPNYGWENFKTLSEFYAGETYGKFPVTHYRHELVDGGKLRLWIGSQKMLAEKSYELALQKGGPDWYQARCAREVDGISDWEQHLQQEVDQSVIFEISPAPFEVSQDALNATIFGTHSFVRFHQLVNDHPPYVHSVAFRVELPPAYLETVYEGFSAEGGINWQDMLGKFVSSNLQGVDIRDDGWIASVQLELNEITKSVPAQERFSNSEYIPSGFLPEQMTAYFEDLEPYLKQAFDRIVDAAISGDMDAAISGSNEYLHKAITSYRVWEKLIQARVNGDWDRQIQTFAMSPQLSGIDRIDLGNMLEMTIAYFQAQRYQPPANSCGGGSGIGESSIVNIGNQTIWSDPMPQGGLNGRVESKAGCGKTGCRIRYLHFHCPEKTQGGCGGPIQSGKGHKSCPRCGFTKEEYRKKTGVGKCD